jgi:uncharacterized protein YdcH (DUF465 family)
LPYPLDKNRLPLPTLREQMGPLDNFTSGVKQGWNTGQSMFDAGVAGLARAAGFQDTARDWEKSADEQAAEAAQYANPSVQTAPWREGGGGWSNAAPWLLNQAGQLVGGAAPIAGGLVAGAALSPVLPEAAATGLGFGLAALPQAVGYNYEQVRQGNQAQGLGEPTQEQAQSAAAWGVPAAALNAIAPSAATGIFGRAVAKTATDTASQMASRTMLDAAKDVAKVGVDNALATGAQTAIGHSFRPDVTPEDKTKDMFDSIVTGFIGGVGMGGAGEVAGRVIKRLSGNTPTQDLDAVTKQMLEPEQQPAARPQTVDGSVSFLDEGETPAPQEVAPPDVPRQYMVEAERAARDGTLDQRIAAAEQGGDTLRSRAFQLFKGVLGDESGSLKIGSETGADGKEQLLIDGVDPVTDKDRMALMAERPLGKDRAQAPAGGMFDEANTAQPDMLAEAPKPKADLQALMAASKERGAKAQSLIEEALKQPKPKLILEKDGQTLVLSPGLEGKPYRMTSFDEKGPIGHREYGETDQRWMADEVSMALNQGFKVRESKPVSAAEVAPKPSALGKIGEAISNLAKDERGSLRISDSGADEAAAFQGLLDEKQKKPARVSEPQPFHELLQAKGGIFGTPDTRGHLEKLAPVGDKDEVVTKKGVQTVLHRADPIEMQVRAERHDITDKAEREQLGLGGIDIHEAARLGVELGYLPEGSGPNELVDLLHSGERAYSSADQDQAHEYYAQQADAEHQKILKDNRKAIREQFPDEKQNVISRAAKLWADNPSEFSAEDAVRGAKAEISGGPEVAGFSESAFSEPAEGAPAPVPSRVLKQDVVKAQKFIKEDPEAFDLVVSDMERSGDPRATAYRQVQAEFVKEAEKNAIVRRVGGTEAKFVETPKGVVRLPDPPNVKQPVDRPAGAPAIRGPLGEAPAVPPLPPEAATPRTADEIIAAPPGGGGRGKPPRGGGGGGGGEPPEPPKLPDRDYSGHPLRSVDDVNSAYARFARSVKEGKVGQALRALGLYVTTEHHHDVMYGKLVPEFHAVNVEREKRNAMNQRMQANALHTQAEMKAVANDRAARAAFDSALKVEAAHQLGIDPSVPWERQTPRVRNEGGRYRDIYDKAREAYTTVSKDPKASSVLENMRAQYETNFSMPAAAVLYRYLKRNKNMKEESNADLLARLVSPAHELLNNPDADMSPNGAMTHAVSSLNDLTQIAKELLSRLPEVTKKEIAKDSLGNDYIKETKVSADPQLQEYVDNIESNKGRLKDTVYSHLMRQGKHGLSFTIATDGEGMILPEALKAVQDAVKADGFNVVIDPLSHQPDVFIRSDNTAQIANLKRTIIKLSEAGAVQKDNIKSGDMDLFNKSGSASRLVEKMIQELEASDEFTPPEGASSRMAEALKRKKDDQITMLRNMAIHFMPDASAAKSQLHRQYVAGFEADPFRALAKQSIEVAQHFSNLLGTDEVNDRLGDFKKVWEASKNVDHRLHEYEQTIAALYNHAMGREEDRQLNLSGSWQDMIQSMVFSKMLGFNLSTAILQPLQVATYGIPELSKKVGYMKAATAVAASTEDAYKVMRAVWSEAWNAGGLAITDMPITTEALRRARLDDENTRFAINVINRGHVDTGGINRSLGHIANARLDGGKFERGIDSYTRSASMMGYYAETFTRVQMALAAKKVFEQRHGKAEFGTPAWDKMVDYAGHTIDEALFNYGNDNRALMTANGPKGLFGNTTKLAFVFQSYWMMAAEKMYREMHAIVSHAPGATPEEAAIARKEAWRFMLGHAAATAAVAGALGLPGMAVFSAIYDKLHDKVKPEAGPYDMKQSFANFLEVTFGHSIGDALAHGPSRLLGMDVSGRTSEADFAPVPSFLLDRGPMAPAMKKWAASRMGAGESVVEELARGYDKYNNGDLIGAVASLFPAGGRNMILAGQQAASGTYRDNRGRVIPNAKVTPTGVAVQAIGFKPQPLAREQESDQALRRYDTTMDYESGILVNRMLKAKRDGDRVSYNRMLPEARKFERDHPGHSIVDRVEDTYKREFKERDKALKTGVPHTRWTKDKRRTQMIQPYIDSLPKQ